MPIAGPFPLASAELVATLITSLQDVVTEGGDDLTNLRAAIIDVIATGMTEGQADDILGAIDGGSATALKLLLDAQMPGVNSGEVVLKAASGVEGEAVTDLTGDEAIVIRVFNDDQDVVVGDAAITFPIPPELNGFNLTSASAVVDTAGTTGNLDIQIRNVTQTADMLTTKIRVETGETKSSTGVTGVPDAANDDVATHDVIAIDIDSTQTTEPLGLTVYLSFALP